MIQFSLSEYEANAFHEWDERHDCKLKKYSGTIGGRLIFKFIPTSLGVITKVACSCGEEVDVTEYAKW